MKICTMLIIFCCLFFHCREEPLDYNAFEKIDVHTHIEAEAATLPQAAIANHFRVLTINTEVPVDIMGIAMQRELAVHAKAQYPGVVRFATAFSMQGWDEPDWQQKTIAYLDESFAMGALAVKVWKNIGMVEKDKNGRFIMIDDTRFDPIFDHLAKKGIPVAGHIGEPKNCWLPLEQMTVNGDKSYFKEHPQYHMYLHPDYPSYEALIVSRDHLLEKHPDLKFIGCHMGSLEWSVDELAARFDRFPNMAVDLAARICHLQYQSITNYSRVREFLIKYQDRIIYGTDLNDDGTAHSQDVMDNAGQIWTRDWQYFTTTAKMTVPEVNGEFQGLGLSRVVVEKIFRTNAEKWFPGI